MLLRAAYLASPLFAVVACRGAAPPVHSEQSPRLAAHQSAPDVGLADAATVAPKPTPPSAPAQLEPDGNDEGIETQAVLPARGKFVKVGRHFASLQRTCDLRAFGGKLYAAHATRPLMFSGATITRYHPGEQRFELMFDWNRPGQPVKGGGAGQGFLRVRAIDGRLYVPDADPPYLGLGMTRFGTEGYIFVSGAEGKFAPARRPGFLPPALSKDGKAGSFVLPGALHVFDVIRFRGRLYASTGSVLKDWSKSGASPAALHVSADSGLWKVAATHPDPPVRGSWRFRYLIRFKDRLYAAVTDFDGRDGVDYVVYAPSREQTELGKGRAVQVTRPGGASTVRWFADGGRLYWIVYGGLLVSSDGQSWTAVKLPQAAGQPTDLARVGNALLVLTEHALLRLEKDGARAVASMPGKKSPFRFKDATCAAPLAVLGGHVYAGGQRRGALYRLEPDLVSSD